MYQSQDSRCYVCRETKDYKLYVDHDHTTKKVRQLLCARCNTIAGVLEDKKCMDVIQYLREHSSTALARLELLIKERETETFVSVFSEKAGY